MRTLVSWMVILAFRLRTLLFWVVSLALRAIWVLFMALVVCWAVARLVKKKFGAMARCRGGNTGNFDNIPKLANLAVDCGRHPEVRWAEREDKVYLTVMCVDAKDVKVNLDPESVFTFSGSYGGGSVYNSYKLKLDLLDKVVVEESKVNIGAEKIFCILMKAEKKWWNKLLCGDGISPHYIQVDWDKWVDKYDDKAPSDVDTGVMIFSKFDDMGGDSGDLGCGTVEISGMVFDFAGFSEEGGNLMAHYKYRKYYEMLRRMGLPEDVDKSSLVTLDPAVRGYERILV